MPVLDDLQQISPFLIGKGGKFQVVEDEERGSPQPRKDPTAQVYDYSVPVPKLTLQDMAGIWRVRVGDIPGTDREKMELLDYAQGTLAESGEEYLRSTLWPIDHWQDFLNGNIP
jgi:hypothetical protein